MNLRFAQEVSTEKRDGKKPSKTKIIELNISHFLNILESGGEVHKTSINNLSGLINEHKNDLDDKYSYLDEEELQTDNNWVKDNLRYHSFLDRMTLISKLLQEKTKLNFRNKLTECSPSKYLGIKKQKNETILSLIFKIGGDGHVIFKNNFRKTQRDQEVLFTLSNPLSSNPANMWEFLVFLVVNMEETTEDLVANLSYVNDVFSKLESAPLTKSFNISLDKTLHESNVTLLPEELINATFIEVNLDKENYFLNETINVSGIAIINGSKINDTIKLELFFNESLIFADSINVLNGNYIYSFISDFENDGYYNLKVSYQNISAETTFFYSLVNFTLEGLVCKDFEEQVLWSSNYSLFSEGSTGYYVWNPKFSCSELNVDNCFFSNITLQTRFIFTDLEEGITEGEGYVQISNPKESICAEPEKVKYSDYLAYEILSEEEIKLGRYCGNNKNSNNKCGIEKLNRYNFLNCYGIKVYGSQYLITDVFSINYTLCYDFGSKK